MKYTAKDITNALKHSKFVLESFHAEQDPTITIRHYNIGEWHFEPVDAAMKVDAFMQSGLDQLDAEVKQQIMHYLKNGINWSRNEFKQFVKTLATDAGFDYVETDTKTITSDPL